MVRKALLSTGAAVPDLREPLQEASVSGAVFVPTDTHWTVVGAGVVAEALAGDFRAPEQLASADFQLKPDAPVHHDGDLTRFIDLRAVLGDDACH